MAINLDKFIKDTTSKTPTLNKGINLDKFLTADQKKKVVPATQTVAQPVAPAKTGDIVNKTLPAFLGGGTYKMKVGDNTANIDSGHSNYGGVPTKTGFERADIFPVSLGGVNASSNNITHEKFLPEVSKAQKEGKTLPVIKTATDKYLIDNILPKYNSGAIGLRQAQVLATSFLRDKQEGLDTSNINLGGKVGEVSDKIVDTGNKIGSFLGKVFGKVVEQAKKGTPAAQQQRAIEQAPIIANKKEAIAKEEVYNKTLTPTQLFQKTDPLFVKMAKTASEVTGKEIKPENYVQESKKFSKETNNAIAAKQTEKTIESVAQVVTAPIRFTAGILARDAITLGLEGAKSNTVVTPKTDAQKLLIGEEPIERLSNSKDLYGLIAKNAGVGTAIVAMVALDNPFLLGTGKPVESAIAKIADNKIAELLIKSGAIPAVQREVAEAEIKKLAKEGLEMSAKEITEGATKRLESIGTKKTLTEADKKEAVFLAENADHPEKIAKEYGIKVKNETKTAPVVEVKPQTSIDTLLGKKTASEAPISPELALSGETKAKVNLDKFIEAEKTAEIPAPKVTVETTKIGEPVIATEVKVPTTITKETVKTSPLIQEAQKYKTVDEFLNSPKVTEKVNGVTVFKESKEELTKIFNESSTYPKSVVIKEEKVRPKTERIKYVPVKEQGAEKEFNILAEKEAKVKRQKLSSSVYKRLREEIPQELRATTEYNKLNLKEDARKAVKLIEKDKNKALRIGLGYEDAPNGQTSTAVNIALAEKAKQEGNHALQARLIKSRSLAQTKRGQEIVAEKGSVLNNSGDRYIKELLNARIDKMGDKYLDKFDIGAKLKTGTSKTSATNKIAKEVKKAEKTFKEIDIAAAQKIIDDLACDY